MNRLIAMLCATSTLVAAPVWACAPFHYLPTIADARVLTKDGKWRTIHIEAYKSRLRLEYRSPESPTGRVAVVGEVEDQAAYWFPIATDGALLANSPARKTSWKSALSAVGLPPNLLNQGPPIYSLNVQHGRQSCELETKESYEEFGRKGDGRLCIPSIRPGDAGFRFPLLAFNARSQRIFEVTKISDAIVSEARLRAPSILLANAGCGGRLTG